jgi:hypothetical protein
MWDRVVFGETNGPMKHVRLKAENEVINRKSKGNEQKTDGEMQHSNWPADPVKVRNVPKYRTHTCKAENKLTNDTCSDIEVYVIQSDHL